MSKSKLVESLSVEERRILIVLRIIEQRPKNPETNEYTINEQVKIKLDLNGIKTVGNLRFKNQVENWKKSLISLIEKKLLLLEDGLYSFTDKGRLIGKEVWTEWASGFYDDLLIRSAESKAHAIFCERVFGKNLYQFNVLDTIQLETMLKQLNLQPDDYVLDLGCGLGKVAEYISDVTGAKILGIDFAQKVIEWIQKQTATKKDRLNFQVKNMNNLDYKPETFDAILAIDTLYFVEDLDITISKLKTILKSGGQLALFWGQQRKPDESMEILEPDKTKLAKALQKASLEFEATDFTATSRDMWIREIDAANDLMEMFKEEGNLDLCEGRIIDSKQTMERIDNQKQKRYFYHAWKKGA
ncbi:MAG TPA: class I SAM-dependent methyltransferase [candidate division Zixibacteria bacterium]|nr:class I SAM-dependent methyltransferase [candidate division Zixibacteria bacterium]